MMRFAVVNLAGRVERCIVAMKKPTVSAQKGVAVPFGPSAAVLLATDDPPARGDPSRVLRDLAEELGRMTARAMLRALDDPKIASAVLFRASDAASAVTGTVLTVDCDYTIW